MRVSQLAKAVVDEHEVEEYVLSFQVEIHSAGKEELSTSFLHNSR